MWPFSKSEKQRSDIEEAISLVTEKWLAYSQVKFKDDVPLRLQLELFIEPALKGIVAARPTIAECSDQVLLLVFLNGILEAGTHTATELQDALGIPRSE